MRRQHWRPLLLKITLYMRPEDASDYIKTLERVVRFRPERAFNVPNCYLGLPNQISQHSYNTSSAQLLLTECKFFIDDTLIVEATHNNSGVETLNPNLVSGAPINNFLMSCNGTVATTKNYIAEQFTLPQWQKLEFRWAQKGKGQKALNDSCDNWSLCLHADVGANNYGDSRPHNTQLLIMGNGNGSHLVTDKMHLHGYFESLMGTYYIASETNAENKLYYFKYFLEIL